MQALDLEAVPVATQTYPRKQDYQVLSALAGLAQSLYKFAFDLRILQSPPIGEWAEPFGARQVGSSAPCPSSAIRSMPRTSTAWPVSWPRCRGWPGTTPRTACSNARWTTSANRRSVLPEAFLIADELLLRGGKLIEGLQIDAAASARLLSAYGPFAATERLLMLATRRGGDRQTLHEVIREHPLRAWAAVREGRANPIVELLCADPRITGYVPVDEARALLDVSRHVGDRAVRARDFAGLLSRELG